MTAAVGLGFYEDFSQVEKVIGLTGKVFCPDPAKRALYDRAYAAFRDIYEPLSKIGTRMAPDSG
jgi:hypothetical protein